MLWFKKKQKIVNKAVSFKQVFFVDIIDIGVLKSYRAQGWRLIQLYEVDREVYRSNPNAEIFQSVKSIPRSKLIAALFTDEENKSASPSSI